MIPKRKGTLAIDLGNTTTVIAFQGEADASPELLDLPPISRYPGEVPTLVWSDGNKSHCLFGQEVIARGLVGRNSLHLSRDFKRWIGAGPERSITRDSYLSPEEAGKLFLQKLFLMIPKQLEVKRLVITAPVETYYSYRQWLYEACNEFPVDEIALVDEPTAAALGSGLFPGAKLLVVDFGGSTIDFSLVILEGGEGKASPIAQLLRFNGQDLEGVSKQSLRCAKVLGKAGLQLGGRDLDRWIANSLFPETTPSETLLNAAEKLKCRLSNEKLGNWDQIIEFSFEENKNLQKELCLSRSQFEEILITRGFIDSVSELLKKTLAGGRSNNCSLEDLDGVMLIGGGSQIPLLKKWLKEQTSPNNLLTPPPIEAVAIGALTLTPGVKVRDILSRGISLRCWDKRAESHIWHPLFVRGQTWPTNKSLEIVLAANHVNQFELELMIGEPNSKGGNEVIYVNGIPTIKSKTEHENLTPISERPFTVKLNPPGQPGQDCLKLEFSINEQSQLEVEGFDLRSGSKVMAKSLGTIR